MICSVLKNNIKKEGADALVSAAKDKPQLTTLCGLKPDQTEANFRDHRLDVGDAILLAYDLSKNSVLVKLEYVSLIRATLNQSSELHSSEIIVSDFLKVEPNI